MSFMPATTPIADRFRDKDIWRAPNGHLYSVNSQMGLPNPLCVLRPCTVGVPLYMRRTNVRGFKRTSWGGKQ